MTTNKIDHVPNVPPLRFPQFKEEWERCLLETVTVAISSGKSHVGNGEYNLYGSTGIIGKTNNACYEGNLVLVARVGANAGLIQIINEKCGVTDNTLVVTPKDIEAPYIYFFLQHFNLNRLIFGSGQPLITGGMLKKVLISFGSKEEQGKITSFLSLLNSRIFTQIRIIDKLESLIKGIRTKVFTDTQPHKRLCDIAEIYQPRTIASTNCNSGQYLVYGANGVIGKHHDYNHEKEQICITCRGNTCGTLNYSKPYSWINGNAMVINVDNNADVDKRYLFHYLSSINFQNIISGSGQPQIVRTPLLKLKVFLPIKERQIKLSKTLDLILQRIELEKQLVDKLKEQKSYLLSQMFI